MQLSVRIAQPKAVGLCRDGDVLATHVKLQKDSQDKDVFHKG